MVYRSTVRFILRLLLLCLSVLFIYLMYILFPFYQHVILVICQILLPFVIAGLIAYLLHPIVKKIQTYDIPRTLSIIIIYLLFFFITGIIIYIYFPTWMSQLQDLQENIPQFIDAYREFIYQLYVQTSFLSEGFHDNLDLFFQDLEQGLGDRIQRTFKNIPLFFDIFVMLAVIPILTFYFLKDYKKLQENILYIIPSKYRTLSKQLGREMENSLGKYIRGQILVCALVGVISYLLLNWIGMKYSIVLATVMGLTNFIPYFGPIIGAIPAVLIAFTISTKMVLYVIAIILVVQLTEGNLLSPFIVGKSIHIHPVYIILTLFIAAQIAGVIGMIIAVPLLAVGRVTIPLIYHGAKRL